MTACFKQVERFTKGPACGESHPSPDPKCSDISDDICNTLWSTDHRGKMKVSDGEINVGASEKSEFPAAKIEDLNALIASENRLPEDLRKAAKPILDQLKSALSKEKDSKDWYRSMSLIDHQWLGLLEKVSEDRSVKKHPELKGITEKNLTIEQKALLQFEANAIVDEVTTAKYKQHPHWQRVERVFLQAKEDLKTEIEKMPIPDIQKQKHLDKIASIKLTLPFVDPNILGAKSDCGKSEKNAFYSPIHHAFTVCAGFFNSFRSDSALFGTIAHELAHSIDPVSFALDQSKDGWLSTTLAPLLGAQGPKIPCDQWRKMSSMISDSIAPPISQDARQGLFDCLSPKETLEKLELGFLRTIATQDSEALINDNATQNVFLKLGQPTITENGVTRQNEFFMRPDRLLAFSDGNTFINPKLRTEASSSEIFTQALSCALVSKDGKLYSYQEVSPPLRAQIFDRAIQETTIIMRAQNENWYSHCGTNCPALVPRKYATNSNENFADFMSYKALGHHVARKSQLRDRRESAALASVDLCDPPGPKNDAPDLAAAEKKYSWESHPDHRIRRISTFNKKNAELIKCQISPNDQGFALCDL